MANPSCSICYKTLSIVNQNHGILYEGIACTACKRILCMDCLKALNGMPPGRPCPKCGGEVKPAYADVVASLNESQAAQSASAVSDRIDDVIAQAQKQSSRQSAGPSKSEGAGNTLSFLSRFFKREKSAEVVFTIWVPEKNPSAMYLMGILMGTCESNPEIVPDEIRKAVQGDSPQKPTWRVRNNPSKGGSDVDFILK